MEETVSIIASSNMLKDIITLNGSIEEVRETTKLTHLRDLPSCQ